MREQSQRSHVCLLADFTSGLCFCWLSCLSRLKPNLWESLLILPWNSVVSALNYTQRRPIGIYLFRAAVRKQPRERQRVGACGGRGIFKQALKRAYLQLSRHLNRAGWLKTDCSLTWHFIGPMLNKTQTWDLWMLRQRLMIHQFGWNWQF